MSDLALSLDLAGGIDVANRTIAARPLTDSEREELADEFDPSLLQTGLRYRAIGPAAGSKLGPPNEVLITGLVPGKGYRTDSPRQAASLIRFGCERFWDEILDV